jgi:hypothetical protein
LKIEQRERSLNGSLRLTMGTAESDMRAHAVKVGEIVDQISPLLAGRGPEVQGAVLGELVATWLAGYQAIEDDVDIDACREELLHHHVRLIRALIPIQEALLLKRATAEMRAKLDAKKKNETH